jgi:TetR/AcrR family transcriptional regulator, transcriptional repressor for nem operon
MPRPSVKEQLIEAAVETLHRQGFNATGVQSIVDAAGVPKGSFYNHFESKEALGVESLDRYWQGVLRSLSILRDPEIPPVPRLKGYFRSLDEILRKRKYLSGCMIGNMATEMADQSSLIREHLAMILAAWTRAIESCVKEAQADGSMRKDIDSKTIASFLLNAWEGTVMRGKVDKDRTALAAFEKVVFTTLC